MSLRRDEPRARRIAATGSAFAFSHLHWDAALAYTRITLRALSTRLSYAVLAPAPSEGYRRIERAEDIAALINCEEEEACPCRGWDCPARRVCDSASGISGAGAAGARQLHARERGHGHNEAPGAQARHHDERGGALGYCEVTQDDEGDCEAGNKGSWKLTPDEARSQEGALRACTRKCDGCAYPWRPLNPRVM